MIDLEAAVMGAIVAVVTAASTAVVLVLVGHFILHLPFAGVWGIVVVIVALCAGSVASRRVRQCKRMG